jgi:hypothetical protein
LLVCNYLLRMDINPLIIVKHLMSIVNNLLLTVGNQLALFDDSLLIAFNQSLMVIITLSLFSLQLCDVPKLSVLSDLQHLHQKIWKHW